MTAAPDSSTGPPSVLPEEQRGLLAAVNDTDVPRGPATLAHLVGLQAAAAPAAPAVIAPRRTLDRAELMGRAGTVAARLTPGERVGLVVEPGWEQIVAALAAAAAGAAVVPLDPALQPSARWNRLVDLTGGTVLTQSWLRDRFDWPPGARCIAVDELDPLPGPPAAAADVPGDAPAALFARGGDVATLRHDVLANAVLDLGQRWALDGSDRVLAPTPLLSAASLAALLGPLAAGAATVVPDDIDLHNPPAWVDLIESEGVTCWVSPPALLALLLRHLSGRREHLPATVRLVALGGEPLTPALVRRLREATAPGGDPPVVVNLGRGAPGSGWATAYTVGTLEPSWKHVPVGRPIANERVFVLGEDLQPCPVWVQGRVHHGGPFVPPDAPLRHPSTGEPLIAGDQSGRLLPDGSLDVTGSDEARATVQGQPVNLRDVEAALARDEEVFLATVVPLPDEGSVAYVQLVEGSSANAGTITDRLRRRVSPYVLPLSVELVATVPLTPEGTVDRTALADVAGRRLSRGAADDGPALAPAGEEELTRQVARITATLLDVPEVDPAMNLLDLGATSIQLVRLATLIEEELGVQVDVEELLRFPSVAVIVSAELGSGRPLAPLAPPGSDAQDGTAVDAGAPVDLPPATATPADARGLPDEDLVTDPEQRLEFKRRRPAQRRDLDDAPAVVLSPGDDAELDRRRTVRRFRSDPVPGEALGRLLAVLREVPVAGVLGSARRYPSAGELYPVQTYVAIADGRVTLVPPGVHYLDPAGVTLRRIADRAPADPAMHAWINRAAFRGAAFSLYLVADLDAVRPMYGERGRDYALLEAGAMLQLLMTAAARESLSLCPVGDLDRAPLAAALRITDRHEVVHTILGGLPAPDGATAAADLNGMLRRADRTDLIPEALR